MPLTIQNLIVLLAVAGCGFILLRQMVGSFTGKRRKLGNCCAKGCSAGTVGDMDASTSKPQTVFIPVESLRSCGRSE